MLVTLVVTDSSFPALKKYAAAAQSLGLWILLFPDNRANNSIPPPHFFFIKKFVFLDF